MVTLKSHTWRRERVGIPLACATAVAAIALLTTGVQAATPGAIIVVQLKNDLSQFRQQAVTDASVKRSLNALAQSIPDIGSSFKRSARQNELKASYGIERSFTVDVSTKTPAQRNQIQQHYLQNALVLSADINDVSDVPATDVGHTVKARLGARASAELEARYKAGPIPEAGYVLGGINANAVSAMPGGKGDYARVVIASNNYWNRSHESLPSVAFSPIRGPQRLSCSTYYDVGNNATAAAGIIAGKNNGVGVAGIVPNAQLAAAPATFGGLYDEIYDLGLKSGDVVVLDAHFSNTTTRFGDHTTYPGDVCPKANPTDKYSTTCQLPSVAYESTQRRIEILTEVMGVHVVLSTSGGVDNGQHPASPMNLDAPDFNGLFDPDRNDDGAIYVAGIDPKTGASLGSNYGRRVDLATWATDIAYPSYHPGGGHNTYSRYDKDDVLNYPFAAYIAAGAVAQVQSVAFAKGLGPVPPKLMRRLLVETGHDIPGHDANQPVGKQPDVKAAVDKMLTEYARGFPPEPEPPFRIKRVVGFDAPYYGRDWEYRPITNPANALGVTYRWNNVEEPLIAAGPTAADGTRRLGVDWSDGLKARNQTITLTARDSRGATDTWTRQLSVPPIVWRYNGEWNVPDELSLGQSVTLSGKLMAPLATGHKVYYYWKAPALFHGIKEGVALMPNSYSLPLTVPASIEPGTAVNIQFLATDAPFLASTQFARTQPGMLLSKTVTIKQGAGSGPSGTLTGPSSVQGGSHYLFKVDNAQDPAASTLTYRWMLPTGFADPGNNPTAMGFAPGLTETAMVPVKVEITNAQGQSVVLSQDVTLAANLPSGEIQGPSPIVMNSGETRVIVVKATVPGGGIPGYRWSVPQGFTSTGATTDTLTLTAPTTEQPMTAVVSVIVSAGSTNQVILSRNLTVQPSASGPGAGACGAPWNPSTAYPTPGVVVSYGGINYAVAHWTQGQQPDQNFVLSGSAKPWRQVGPCSP
ncbi:hypothetical protein DYL61_19710 [Pseudomonas nabeulensis]|uniref:Chitin-binding type-3 domain-containing protein n=1 Tax=Pseudomonas nabeulensis TaxID=2293833 RepID=A0A4Z0AYB8_9PSED|nr:hypothetical protein [Pseudomonas nabeulensis]TFY90918.1 hypothetical protein DYL61_19710 [Pseudomonas nabeulensis]